ncbi:MAG: hypothetical protein LN568_00150 [Rickettsia endosymbiont of Pseudomimeciton antennatum]|nr:hypothetical protein [Rickettsia endosymbiont of Pseudomimeciton antennatum]
MPRIEIKSNEYKILGTADDLVLYTKELNDEIACSFFSKQLKKVALSRNISSKQSEQLINEMNPEHLVEAGLIKVQIIGGRADSEESSRYLKQLMKQLTIIDNDIIDIISCDTDSKLHPNSLEVDCYHGGVRAIGENVVSSEN